MLVLFVTLHGLQKLAEAMERVSLAYIAFMNFVRRTEVRLVRCKQHATFLSHCHIDRLIVLA